MVGFENFNFGIIKGYDIRGIYSSDLKDNDVYIVGLSIGFWIKNNLQFNKKIVIGYDNRKSSEKIFRILSYGLNKFDIQIISIGLSSSPIVSFGAKIFDCCSIMITASHNNIAYNGMKFSQPHGQSMDGKMIKQILIDFIESSSWCDYEEIDLNREIFVDNDDIFQRYIDFLFSAMRIKMNRKVKIAFDFLGNSVEKRYKEFFADYPNCFFVENDSLIEDPDPTIEKNSHHIKKTILQNQCDIGFVFDGDSDRVVVFDENGKKIQTEHIIMIAAKGCKKIVIDSKCSAKLRKYIDCEIITSKIGHSIIKNEVQKSGADFAGEISGHFIFKNVGFDDGFCMAIFLINYLCNRSEKLSEIVDGLPQIYCSDNIKLYLPEDGVEKIMSVVANQKGVKIEFFDGIKIFYDEGWIFFRESQTEQCLTVKYEGYDLAGFECMKSKFDFFCKSEK